MATAGSQSCTKAWRVHPGWKRTKLMFACIPWTRFYSGYIVCEGKGKEDCEDGRADRVQAGSAGTTRYMSTESRFTNALQAGLWYGASMRKTGIHKQSRRSGILDPKEDHHFCFRSALLCYKLPVIDLASRAPRQVEPTKLKHHAQRCKKEL